MMMVPHLWFLVKVNKASTLATTCDSPIVLFIFKIGIGNLATPKFRFSQTVPQTGYGRKRALFFVDQGHLTDAEIKEIEVF